MCSYSYSTITCHNFEKSGKYTAAVCHSSALRAQTVSTTMTDRESISSTSSSPADQESNSSCEVPLQHVPRKPADTHLPVHRRAPRSRKLPLKLRDAEAEALTQEADPSSKCQLVSTCTCRCEVQLAKCMMLFVRACVSV